jgi:CRP/FNR family cyclic AMP-dependent transcriptional regulator
MAEKIWFLKRCDLFERLKPTESEHLERRAVMRAFKRGNIIYFPDDPGRSVLVLLRGRVKIKSLTAQGKETILAFIDEGEIFGELALFDGEARQEYAEAVETSQVLVIPTEDIHWLLERRPDVALSITKLLGLRRRRIENRLRNILFCSIRERIIHLLLELVETHGRLLPIGWEIGLRLSHQDLANLIGATRETVTLGLGQLRSEQYIRVSRQRIIIVNREALAREVHGTNRTIAEPEPGCCGQ